MNQLSPAIRKAAILVAALDEGSAEALLEQMDASTASVVRSALVELGEVSADEQREVLSEFCRGQPSVSAGRTTTSRGDVVLEESLIRRINNEKTTAVRSKPFSFLRRVPAEAVAQALLREHPQTIAAVVSQLEADLAARTLENMPFGVATDILQRMAWLADPAPEVLADIERQLEAELAPFAGGEQRHSPAVDSLQAVLSEMDDRSRKLLLSNLAQRNASLVRRLGYAPAPDAESDYRIMSFRVSSAEQGPARDNRLAYRLAGRIDEAAFVFEETA